jgi:methionyl-tRNA formyltransferase
LKYALFLNQEDFLYAGAVDRVLGGRKIDAIYIFPSKALFAKQLGHLLAGVRVIGFGNFLRLLVSAAFNTLFASIRGRRERVSIAAAASRYGVPLLHFKDVNSAEVLSDLKTRKVDIVLNICSQIYREKALQDLPPVYNFHGGFVPGNAGRFPVFWAFVKGFPQVVTCHRVTSVIDGGVPVLHYPIETSSADTVWTVTLKIRARFPEIIERAMQLIDDGRSEALELSIPRFYGPTPTSADVALYRRLLRDRRNTSRRS